MATETKKLSELEPDELAREVAGEIYRRLWEQTRGDRELERWFAEQVSKSQSILRLGEELVYTSRSRKELEESVRRVVEALPRYVKLVKKVMDVKEPFWYVAWEVPNQAIKIFKSLAPLASEPRKTNLRLFGRPVYVGEWIEVLRTDHPVYIESAPDGQYAVEFIAERGEELAKHIDDEEKREAFLRLAELARGLFVRPSRVCAGEVSTYNYYYSLYDRQYEVVPATGKLCMSRNFYDTVLVGEHGFTVLDPSSLPSLIPIMDKVEELYGRLVEALRDAAEHNRRVLEEMRRVARPYIVARVLG